MCKQDIVVIAEAWTVRTMEVLLERRGYKIAGHNRDAKALTFVRRPQPSLIIVASETDGPDSGHALVITLRSDDALAPVPILLLLSAAAHAPVLPPELQNVVVVSMQLEVSRFLHTVDYLTKSRRVPTQTAGA